MSDYADAFVVVNGPEDGTEFPVVRAPVRIGRDPDCAIHLRLDNTVQNVHAQLGAVSDGYRVRRTTPALVLADNRRVGAVRSRILRDGSVLRVGHTLLMLKCAPDGLASRSHGIVTESDLAWAAAQSFKWGLAQLKGLLRAVGWMLRKLLRNWKIIVGLIVLAAILYPPFRYALFHTAQQIYYHILYAIRRP